MPDKETQPRIEIDFLSTTVVQFATVVSGIVASEATGFIYSKGQKKYLVPNWHVFTGINAETSIRIKTQPDRIRVWFYSGGTFSEWKCVELPLYKDGEPLWLEHPRNTQRTDLSKIDVVALPIPENEALNFNSMDPTNFNHKIAVEVGEQVSIIGFPLGHVVNGKIPIWKSGHIASDMTVPYLGNPVFLVDVRTKPAMSGSPAIVKRTKHRQIENGQIVEYSRVYKLLGIYSGRTCEQSDIGMIWKTSVLEEILP